MINDIMSVMYRIIQTDLSVPFSLFIDESRVVKRVREHLCLDDVTPSIKIFPYNGIQEELRTLGQMEKKIWVGIVMPCGIFIW